MVERGPLVSVVVPAYEAGSTIGATLSSLLWQTHRDLEVIVVDDGSTDATSAVVGAHDDPRIRLIRQDNAGPGAARNRGLEAARGDLFAFVDADDVLLPDYLAACLSVWHRAGGIVTSNAFWMFPGGIDPALTRHRGPIPRPQDQRLTLLHQNWVSIMSVFPRKLVEDIGLLDEELERAEDWDFWLRAIFAGHRVSLQRQPLALYRWGDAGLSADWREMDADIEAIFTGLEQRVQLTEDERSYVQRRLGGPGPRVLGREGDAALRAGRYRHAARAYREAARLCPAERPLVWKARVLSLFPPLVGPLVRARQLRIEQEVGWEEDHQR